MDRTNPRDEKKKWEALTQADDKSNLEYNRQKLEALKEDIYTSMIPADLRIIEQIESENNDLAKRESDLTSYRATQTSIENEHKSKIEELKDTEGKGGGGPGSGDGSGSNDGGGSGPKDEGKSGGGSGSLVEDFADPSQDMPSYMDPED